MWLIDCLHPDCLIVYPPACLFACFTAWWTDCLYVSLSDGRAKIVRSWESLHKNCTTLYYGSLDYTTLCLAVQLVMLRDTMNSIASRAMALYATPCHALPYHAIQFQAMPNNAMLCSANSFHAFPWHAKLCNLLLYHAMLCHAMLCYVILRYARLCHVMLCYALLC